MSAHRLHHSTCMVGKCILNMSAELCMCYQTGNIPWLITFCILNALLKIHILVAWIEYQNQLQFLRKSLCNQEQVNLSFQGPGAVCTRHVSNCPYSTSPTCLSLVLQQSAATFQELVTTDSRHAVSALLLTYSQQHGCFCHALQAMSAWPARVYFFSVSRMEKKV